MPALSMCHEAISPEQVRCALGDLSSDMTEIQFTLDFLREETEAAPTRDRLNTHQHLDRGAAVAASYVHGRSGTAGKCGGVIVRYRS